MAFTRAKTKLLVVGSRSTLSGAGKDEMLVKFMGMMEQKGWVYDLRDGALEEHCFDGPVPATVTGGLGGHGQEWHPSEDQEEEEVVGRGSWEIDEPRVNHRAAAATKTTTTGTTTTAASAANGMRKTRSPKRVVTSNAAGGGEKRRRGAQLMMTKDALPSAASGGGVGDENVPPPGSWSNAAGHENGNVKRARIGERAILKGKPVLRDILNDLANGGY